MCFPCIPRSATPHAPPLPAVSCELPLDFALDKAPNERLDIDRGFNFADTSSRLEDAIRPPRGNTDVLLANESTRPDGGNGVFLQLHLLLQTQGHVCSVVRETDILHPSDLYPGNLNRRADTQASHGGEHRGQVIGTALTKRELAKTDREIPQ